MPKEQKPLFGAPNAPMLTVRNDALYAQAVSAERTRREEDAAVLGIFHNLDRVVHALEARGILQATPEIAGFSSLTWNVEEHPPVEVRRIDTSEADEASSRFVVYYLIGSGESTGIAKPGEGNSTRPKIRVTRSDELVEKSTSEVWDQTVLPLIVSMNRLFVNDDTSNS